MAKLKAPISVFLVSFVLSLAGAGTALGSDGFCGLEQNERLATLQASIGALNVTTGEQRLLVMLVNFQEDPSQPYSIEQVQSIVFGEMRDFFRKASYGQTDITGTVVGWFTLPIAPACDDRDRIAQEALQASRRAGVNPLEFNRHMVVFPRRHCPWTGWATVGGNPSMIWINGQLNVQVAGHEFGHNLGLSHAKSYDCGALSLNPQAGACVEDEYGDRYDIMGGGGHAFDFNNNFKERLGWLNVPRATASGIYEITTLESQAPGQKGLKIQSRFNDQPYIYYLEYRQDAAIQNDVVRNGVLVRLGGNSTRSLDMTRETGTWVDAALPIGRTYRDPGLGFTITPLSKGPNSIRVQIDFNPSETSPLINLPGSSSGLSLVKSVFNPEQGEEALITSRLEEGRGFSLMVLDRYGNEVRMLKSGVHSANEPSVPWNGRNSAGSIVPSGLYHIVMMVENQPRAQEKVAVVK